MGWQAPRKKQAIETWRARRAAKRARARRDADHARLLAQLAGVRLPSLTFLCPDEVRCAHGLPRLAEGPRDA